MELSEEEKKAVEYLENRLDILHNNTQWATEKSIKVVLNLIEKQQKEIKKEKSRIMELAELLDKQENEINSLQQELEIQKGCSISKDKIREIIAEYKKQLQSADTERTAIMLSNFIMVLNDLLEEK